jgi:hypothetical protein
MRPTPLLVSTLIALLAAAPGCSGPGHAKVLRADAGAVHVRGDYVGSQRRVKLFVEYLHAEPTLQGRGTRFVAKVVLLNERAEACSFDGAEARMLVGEMKTPASETQVTSIRPGELRRISLTFTTRVAFDDVGDGILEIAGISPDVPGGAKPAFQVPWSLTGDEVEGAR